MRAASRVCLLFTGLTVVHSGCEPGQDETAITDRPLGSPAHSCRVARDRTDHSPRQWSGRQALLPMASGAAFFGRLEATAPDPTLPIIPGRPQMMVSRLGADGSFGPPVTLSSADPATLGSITLAPSAGGFAGLWVEGGALRFAAFDAEGALTAAARTVAAPGAGRDSRPKMVAGRDGGFGVVYTVTRDELPAELWFLALDASGAVRSAARRVGSGAGAYSDPGASIAATPEGYALLWRGPAGKSGRIELYRTDLQGVETMAARGVSPPVPREVTIAGTAGFDPATTALLPVEGGLLAAWIEARLPPDGAEGAWSMVRVARLSPEGALQASAPLRAPTADIDEVEPSLVAFGEAVAVLWGRGSHIYICGGCVPDHRIDLLLMDPRSLAPLSRVVSLDNGGPGRSGGLLRREVAVLGSSLLTTFNLTFHVHATPGSGTFTCDKNP